MKILITGGAGYTGSHIIKEILQNTDWDVASIDDYTTSSEKKYARIETITYKKVLFNKIIF
tara:strand:+ start:163 stop:345 length:183 start_codon:yes stop_codon:yes gene_type:complete